MLTRRFSTNGAHRGIGALLLWAGALAASPAGAGGLLVYEVGTADVGLASAGYGARAQDASTVFTNPAGMTRLEGNQVLAAGQLLWSNTQFSIDSGTSPNLGDEDGGRVTVMFSDRPERIAGHMATSRFVPFWGEGKDSFLQDPPNATLSFLEKKDIADAVVVLRDPVLKKENLSYKVKVLEGDIPAIAGAASLFIDIIGMPLTPVSFAGARRRMWRQAVIY
jgi:hypothetical protein